MVTEYNATLPTFVDGQKHGRVQTTSGGVLLTATAPGSAGGAASTGTLTTVNDTASSTTILAANASRRGATIWNDSTATLYLLLASGTASATNASLSLLPGETFLLENGEYTGIIVGIWSADASGAARVTEFT